MNILVTAFEPFNGSAVNPSQMILEKIDLSPTCGAKLFKKLLPVEFSRSSEVLRQTIDEIRPDAVISLGQAGNRPEICIERAAINLDCARSSNGNSVLADNAGETPVDQPIEQNGENAYFSTLPVWEIIAAVRDAGVECAASYSAGTYVCNHVMYTALHIAAQDYPEMKPGFIHVPFLPEQMNERSKGFSMELCDMVKAIQTVLETVVKTI